jgi:hypothetical protein
MLVAVGGHSRNVGKTSVVCGIVSALPQYRWQAVKITQHGHNVCAADGEDCGCASNDPAHPYAIDEQKTADATDSGRYLAAGAVRSYWLRTAQGELGHALPELKRLLAQAEHTIVESNSILRFFQPALYIVVLDFENEDMKDSVRQNMDRADVFLIHGKQNRELPWAGIPPRWLQAKPCFPVTAPRYLSDEAIHFIESRLQTLQVK